MTTPAEAADDNHGRVAKIVSIALVSLYALVALGWAATAPEAEAITPPTGVQVESTAR
ncbi:hypothetical protein [Lutibaculum baratangense]|uniref:Uncharacterized protein n=1 Tax=Lutibaculum baratangense AMV1 TaxID=631454 RepID=V4RHB0_9HYPH|nr:hypothetical protein [Lutibaculum baratangense]ESR25506.1 hypothetical protein N177_1618 [Lutibaculum baratangense AMV1]